MSDGLTRIIKEFLRGLEQRPELSVNDCWAIGRVLDHFANGECFRRTGHIVFWPSAATIASIIKRNRRNTRLFRDRLETTGIIAPLWWSGPGRGNSVIYELLINGVAGDPISADEKRGRWQPEKGVAGDYEKGSLVTPDLVEENRLNITGRKESARSAFFKISTEIIREHGPERGWVIIESYQRGEPEGKRIFNLTDQRMRTGKDAPRPRYRNGWAQLIADGDV